ncbi:hypothetical protein [Mesorhizobium sp. LNJC394B00]|uniref:hypothetical protein n=1 Tax=unclassified Mesorhizobium TaxID=325217 RepID=UPI0003CEA497|nr:hypothetical protein [Mesorhizobium sp. LNJC394B00]ESY20705.1 hypothetical protein X750_18455 [Mesorhizobium sp. LNJC394B00]
MAVQLLGAAPIRAGWEKAYDAAVLFEARYPRAAPPTQKAVAKHLLDEGVLPTGSTSQETAEAMVQEWRWVWHYVAGVDLYRGWMTE